MPVAQKFLAATTTTKVTSLTHEEIRTESNNHLKIRRQENSPEMDLKPPSSSKSQGVQARGPQKQTLTVSAAALPGMSHEKPAYGLLELQAELCRNVLLVPHQGFGVLHQISLLLHIRALLVDDAFGALRVLLNKLINLGLNASAVS